MSTSRNTRQYILDTSFWEIFQRGFTAVSVNDIIAKTTVTKGAFFHYFPTKNELGYAIVDEIITELTMARWIRPLDSYVNPIDGILNNLEKIIKATNPDSLSLGCPLNNLIQEMSTQDPIFHQKLQQALELWISEIEKQVKNAQLKGYVKKEVDAREVAEFVVMAHEGAFGMSKSYRDISIFWTLHKSLEMYLGEIRA